MVSARRVLEELLRQPDGFYVLWPPWPRDRHDTRRAYLYNLARYHQLKVEITRAPQDHLWVRLKENQGRDQTPLKVLSPIEYGKAVAEAETNSIGLSDSFLRPPDREGYEETEPYYVYIQQLVQFAAEDLGAGVVYPYHDQKDRQNQKIRLYQEASRYGISISIRRLDGGHALLQLKRGQRLPVNYDPRRQYEREVEEPAVVPRPGGGIILTGGGPVKEPARLRDRKLAEHRSMNDQEIVHGPAPAGTMEDL